MNVRSRVPLSCIWSRTSRCLSVTGPKCSPRSKSVYPIMTANGVFSSCATEISGNISCLTCCSFRIAGGGGITVSTSGEYGGAAISDACDVRVDVVARRKFRERSRMVFIVSQFSVQGDKWTPVLDTQHPSGHYSHPENVTHRRYAGDERICRIPASCRPVNRFMVTTIDYRAFTPPSKSPSN